MGRVIRSKTDYGIMVLADQRYSRADKRSKLPSWIRRYIKDNHLNMSTDMCVSSAKDFLSKVSRKEPWQEQVGTILLGLNDITGRDGVSSAPAVLPKPAPRPSIDEKTAKGGGKGDKAPEGAGSRAQKKAKTVN